MLLKGAYCVGEHFVDPHTIIVIYMCDRHPSIHKHSKLVLSKCKIL